MAVVIEFTRVENVSVTTKDGKTKVTMDVEWGYGDVARLVNLSRQDVPMRGNIVSDQAEFDLKIERVNAFTGLID